MKKSANAWDNDEDDEEMYSVWDFIEENPHLLGLPISESKGLDLLSALHDIYRVNKKDHTAAQMLLTLLAKVLVAMVQGDGEEIVEEVLIQDAMHEFDKKLKEMLDEEY